MDTDEKGIAERLEAATSLLEKSVNWLEERQSVLSGEVERISATVEQSRRETELAEKLAAAERELAEVKAATAQNVLQPLRRTMPAATAEMLAKHGVGDGPVDVRTLDAALSGPEPGTAYRGQNPTAARRSNRINAVDSGQCSAV
jgi:septal ring factor EnvC (AmiA/AmiB activator)